MSLIIEISWGTSSARVDKSGHVGGTCEAGRGGRPYLTGSIIIDPFGLTF